MKKIKQFVKDGFQNFSARLGLGTGNQLSDSTYGFNFISRNRLLLEAMYRTAWLVRMVVDAPAEDMTRAGIDIESTMTPEQIDVIESALMKFEIWDKLAETIRWSRLFGGAIGVLLIDGQDVSTPLDLGTISKGQFKGLLVLDRWMVDVAASEVITDLGPNLGKPKYYRVIASAPALPLARIHHSRVIRMEGDHLPFFQRQTEQNWGQSVIEKLYDRLVSFDSATTGAAQLIYKAHLRTLKVEGLRDLIAEGGEMYEAMIKNVEMIRLLQSNEGLTLLDSTDDFATHSYSFSGLSDVLLQFGQQLSGATEIPLVRLFGQSPTGLNSSGESDLRTYYDGINKKQNSRLTAAVRLVLRCISLSEIGTDLPQDFRFSFNPLWQLTETEKADIAAKDTTTVTGAYSAGIIDDQIALRELRQSSRTTGRFSNITDADIEAASLLPPLASMEDPNAI